MLKFPSLERLFSIETQFLLLDNPADGLFCSLHAMQIQLRPIVAQSHTASCSFFHLWAQKLSDWVILFTKLVNNHGVYVTKSKSNGWKMKIRPVEIVCDNENRWITRGTVYTRAVYDNEIWPFNGVNAPRTDGDCGLHLSRLTNINLRRPFFVYYQRGNKIMKRGWDEDFLSYTLKPHFYVDPKKVRFLTAILDILEHQAKV